MSPPLPEPLPEPQPYREPSGLPRCARPCPRFAVSSDDPGHPCYFMDAGDLCQPAVLLDYAAHPLATRTTEPSP